MVEYKKIFLSEMKSLLFYFVKFSDNEFIFPKVYPDNCTIKDSDQKLIIMIIHDESILFTNNDYQKVWTLNEYNILQPKQKRKRIMIIDFLLQF